MRFSITQYDTRHTTSTANDDLDIIQAVTVLRSLLIAVGYDESVVDAGLSAVGNGERNYDN